MMYSFECDDDIADTSHLNCKIGFSDIKRMQAIGTYQQVGRWSLDPAKQVTSMACVNGVQSPLLFAASSDKQLHILDVGTGKFLRQIETSGSHERSISCIALPQPSMYVSMPMEGYNIFATSAPGHNSNNAICLWDLRSPRIISRFSGHVNHVNDIQCSISPCLRFLATGSEDKTARLVDLRAGTGKELARLKGFKDVVSDAVFNPLYPQLAACSFAGEIQFFCDPDASERDFIGI